MTDVAQTPDAVPSEIEVTSPVVWEAFILDESGFVVSEDEAIDDILAHFPDEETIDHTWGDVFPAEIVIVTGTASPKPSGSSRRMPGSHYTTDKVWSYDLEQTETSEELVLLWEYAQAMTEGLNAYEVRKHGASR